MTFVGILLNPSDALKRKYVKLRSANYQLKVQCASQKSSMSVLKKTLLSAAEEQAKPKAKSKTSL